MVRKGERYKSYREVCKAMSEDVASGNKKIAQLKRWGRLFKYHTDGNAYVIDKVYEKPLEIVDRRGGNNAGNVNLFMPYVTEKICNKRMGWVGTQRLMCEILELIPREIYKQLNDEETSREKFIEMYGLESYDSFVEFAHAYERVTVETFIGCLNKLKKQGCIKWQNGHMFKVGTRFLCTTECEEIIDGYELTVCGYLNERYKYKGKGRQVLWQMRGRPGLVKEYYTACLLMILNDEAIKSELARLAKRKGIDIDTMVIEGYYKGIYIEKIKMKDKAPPGSKEKLYENIFTRIKKRVSIPDSDFEKLKTLFVSGFN